MMEEWLENSVEVQALRQHYQTYFGPLEKTYIERARTYFEVPVEVLVLGPTEKRPYKVLATLGLSHYKMNVPEHLAGYGLEYAELVMAIPSDWPAEEGDWPVQWLAEAAQLASRKQAWLGWGYVSELETPAENDFSGIMLMLPDEFAPKAAECRVNERDDVHFYQVVPLYPEELALAQAQGMGALMERFDSDFSPVVDTKRKNYA